MSEDQLIQSLQSHPNPALYLEVLLQSGRITVDTYLRMLYLI